MSAMIIEFKSPIKPIAQFVHVDHAHRRLGGLDVNLECLKKRLGDHHRKIGKLSGALGLLHDERGAGAPRAPVAMTRGSEQSSKERNEP